jgi:hypothetical protein
MASFFKKREWYMGMGNGRQFPCVAAFSHTQKGYSIDSDGISINPDLTRSLKSF